MKKTMLFCLPFAGGNKYAFRPYYPFAPAGMELTTIEYPGRGLRADEDYALSLEELADDAYARIAPHAADGNYALYGHSMGGLVTSLVLRRLLAGLPAPIHVFITGAAAPASRDRLKDQWHLLDHDEFIGKIRELKGAPDEVWSNPELVDYIMPVLRADFHCYETYLHQPSPALAVSFTVITGSLEDFEAEEIAQWQEESQLPVNFITLQGDHFFIYKHAKEIMNIIGRTVQAAQAATR